MKTMKKKCLSGILTFCLIVSCMLIPAINVHAETAEDGWVIDAAGRKWSDDDYEREMHESYYLGGSVWEDVQVKLVNGSDIDIANYPYPLFSPVYEGGQYLVVEESGRILNNVVCLVDGNYMYVNERGLIASGCWVDTSNGWMYFGWDGCALISQWIYLNHTWYYLNDKGIMETGWLNRNGTWYYLDESGAMQSGWIKLDKRSWYYLDTSGAMKNGWQFIDNVWYYLDDSGLMAEGWKQVDGTWYYLNWGSGSMQTGWLRDGDSWYYLKDSGAMACNERLKINGVNYSFDKSGRWIEK